MRVRLLCLVSTLLSLVAACGDDPSLLVDLRTDYRPSLELATVETRLLDGEMATAVVEAAADPARDYRAGVRVAELSPGEGMVRIEVRLYAPNGDLLGRRRVVTKVEGPTGVTVVIARDCAAVRCDEATPECLNGLCVADTCDPVRNPDACGAAVCRAAEDCATEGLASCASVDCIDGACLSLSDDTACASSEYCDADDGCTPRPTDTDAGATDAGARDAGVADASTPDAGSCAAGTPCDTGRACELGAIDCSGGAPVCVATGPAPGGTTCRASMGECDVVEACDGTGTECPMDAFQPTGAACSAGSCDGLGSCVSGCTPGTPCGTGNPCLLGMIDCSTGSPVCTGAGAAPSGTLCRAAAGACDVAEVCDGSSTACPADGFVAATSVCRASAGACDPEERCTGASAICPVDARTSAGTACRAASGACDVAESCNGSGVNCPPDGVASAGTSCRASMGVCDIAESCDGSSKSCPANGYAPSSTVCRAASGACDVAETCTGSSATCPADANAPDGTSCSDGAYCNGLERCMGGVCRPATPPCPAAASCDCATYTCNESLDRCDVMYAPDGASCDDGGIVSGSCFTGLCHECAPCIIPNCDAGGGAPGCDTGGGCAACVAGTCP